MSGFLVVVLSVSLTIAGIWLPWVLWIVYLLWGYLLIMSLPLQKFRYNPEEPTFGELEIPILQKYQAFFRMPYTAAALSNAGGTFTIVTFVFIFVYAFLQRWVDVAALAAIWYFLGGFRKRMHPTFMLREEIKRHAACGNPEQMMNASEELDLAQSILTKINPEMAAAFFKTDSAAPLMRREG